MATSHCCSGAQARPKETYGHHPFGQADTALTTGQGSSDATDPLNSYRYSGKRYDGTSGSIDMGARRFGPDVARFLQRDAYQGALADLGLSLDPLTQNRYALAAGNPVSFVEVDGHWFLVKPARVACAALLGPHGFWRGALAVIVAPRARSSTNHRRAPEGASSQASISQMR